METLQKRTRIIELKILEDAAFLFFLESEKSFIKRRDKSRLYF